MKHWRRRFQKDISFLFLSFRLLSVCLKKRKDRPYNRLRELNRGKRQKRRRKRKPLSTWELCGECVKRGGAGNCEKLEWLSFLQHHFRRVLRCGCDLAWSVSRLYSQDLDEIEHWNTIFNVGKWGRGGWGMRMGLRVLLVGWLFVASPSRTPFFPPHWKKQWKESGVRCNADNDLAGQRLWDNSDVRRFANTVILIHVCGRSRLYA